MSAWQRKAKKASAFQEMQFPDTVVVHSDPENGIIIYRMLTSSACSILGQGFRHLCTCHHNTAKQYLELGCLFMMYRYNKRYKKSYRIQIFFSWTCGTECQTQTSDGGKGHYHDEKPRSISFDIWHKLRKITRAEMNKGS